MTVQPALLYVDRHPPNPATVDDPLTARFWTHVQAIPAPAGQPRGVCWLWTGGRNAHGYGVFDPDHGHRVVAHRWIWQRQTELVVPAGLNIDHLCHEWADCAGGPNVCLHRPCVRPDHLGLVANRANGIRSNSLP